MNLASKLFSAELQLNLLEEEMAELIEKTVHPLPWVDFTFDPYDNSIEVYFANELSGEVVVRLVETLRECGFKLVWLHPHDRKPVSEVGRCTCRVHKPQAVQA